MPIAVARSSLEKINVSSDSLLYPIKSKVPNIVAVPKKKQSIPSTCLGPQCGAGLGYSAEVSVKFGDSNIPSSTTCSCGTYTPLCRVCPSNQLQGCLCTSDEANPQCICIKPVVIPSQPLPPLPPFPQGEVMAFPPPSPGHLPAIMLPPPPPTIMLPPPPPAIVLPPPAPPPPLQTIMVPPPSPPVSPLPLRAIILPSPVTATSPLRSCPCWLDVCKCPSLFSPKCMCGSTGNLVRCSCEENAVPLAMLSRIIPQVARSFENPLETNLEGGEFISMIDPLLLGSPPIMIPTSAMPVRGVPAPPPVIIKMVKKRPKPRVVMVNPDQQSDTISSQMEPYPLYYNLEKEYETIMPRKRRRKRPRKIVMLKRITEVDDDNED